MMKQRVKAFYWWLMLTLHEGHCAFKPGYFNSMHIDGETIVTHDCGKVWYR